MYSSYFRLYLACLYMYITKQGSIKFIEKKPVQARFGEHWQIPYVVTGLDMLILTQGTLGASKRTVRIFEGSTHPFSSNNYTDKNIVLFLRNN